MADAKKKPAAKASKEAAYKAALEAIAIKGGVQGAMARDALK